MTLFGKIADIPADPVYGVNELFLNDPREKKVNLTVGIFVEEDGRVAPILHSVHLAEEEILKTAKTKSYIPIDGDAEYIAATKKLIFGDVNGSHIYGAQTIGGTSALRVLADFIKVEVSDKVSISNPTWENHENIFRKAGFHIDKYPYPHGMFEHLAKLPKKTVVLLHAMCHNPTGHELTKAEWERLGQLMKEKELIPFFDSAYQGFATGYDEDMWPVRHFIRQGHECFVASSFSKSFALYGERVGASFVIMKDKELHDKMKRNVRFHIRTSYSSPPRHGAHIVKLILQTPNLFELWTKEITACRTRMENNRKMLSQKLAEKLPKFRREELDLGKGFFCLLGLTKEQELRLRNEFGVYTAGLSRVNLTALTKSNIDYVVDSIAAL